MTDNKKPWESEEDFNPETAWALIQNLRADKTALNERLKAAETAKTTLSEELEATKGLAKNLETEKTHAAAELDKLAALHAKTNLLTDAGLPRTYAGQASAASVRICSRIFRS